MLAARTSHRIWPTFPRREALSLPDWVAERFGLHDRFERRGGAEETESVLMNVGESDGLFLVSVRVQDADALPPLEFQRRTVEAYTAIDRVLRSHPRRHALRIWNWIPRIRTTGPDGIDRYMIFNAGRYASFHSWSEGSRTLPSRLATATGVGHDGSDLVIHVLAADHRGVPLENDRQIQSCRYSRKYGPMPPCFSRAMLTPTAARNLPDLLVGGTASVRGEESVFLTDVASQTRETLENLAHVIATGLGRVGGRSDTTNGTRSLRRLESMRLYYVDPRYLDTILEVLWLHVDHLDPTRLELVRADICREELLVEIEGTACLS